MSRLPTVHSITAERERICERIRSITGWATMKCLLWINTKNPLLGMVSPAEMIVLGRTDRLDRFIDEAEKMNEGTGPQEESKEASQRTLDV